MATILINRPPFEYTSTDTSNNDFNIQSRGSGDVFLKVISGTWKVSVGADSTTTSAGVSPVTIDADTGLYLIKQNRFAKLNMSADASGRVIHII